MNGSAVSGLEVISDKVLMREDRGKVRASQVEVLCSMADCEAVIQTVQNVAGERLVGVFGKKAVQSANFDGGG